MATSEHFFIDPPQITALSNDFSQSDTELGGRVSTFATKAENVNDAFGVMSQSTKALASTCR